MGSVLSLRCLPLKGGDWLQGWPLAVQPSKPSRTAGWHLHLPSGPLNLGLLTFPSPFNE